MRTDPILSGSTHGEPHAAPHGETRTAIGKSSNFDEDSGVVKVETVTKVIDGDSFTTLGNGTIRLKAVDAPEKSEAGYAEATEYLKDLIEEQEVIVYIVAIDPLGRSVADVKVGGVFVNLAMRAFLSAEGYSK